MSQYTTEYLVREITKYLKHCPEAANELLAAVAEGMTQFRLGVQQEVDFDLLRFDHTKYLGFEYEVVNRDGDVINKADMLIAEDKICYKFLDKLYIVYINGRQNIQENHFSDLLLRKEV